MAQLNLQASTIPILMQLVKQMDADLHMLIMKGGFKPWKEGNKLGPVQEGGSTGQVMCPPLSPPKKMDTMDSLHPFCPGWLM